MSERIPKWSAMWMSCGMPIGVPRWGATLGVKIAAASVSHPAQRRREQTWVAQALRLHPLTI